MGNLCWSWHPQSSRHPPPNHTMAFMIKHSGHVWLLLRVTHGRNQKKKKLRHKFILIYSNIFYDVKNPISLVNICITIYDVWFLNPHTLSDFNTSNHTLYEKPMYYLYHIEGGKSNMCISSTWVKSYITLNNNSRNIIQYIRIHALKFLYNQIISQTTL